MHWSEVLITIDYSAKTWNNLPTELKNLTISDRVLKNKLQDFIRENN